MALETEQDDEGKQCKRDKSSSVPGSPPRLVDGKLRLKISIVVDVIPLEAIDRGILAEVPKLGPGG